MLHDSHGLPLSIEGAGSYCCIACFKQSTLHRCLLRHQVCLHPGGMYLWLTACDMQHVRIVISGALVMQDHRPTALQRSVVRACFKGYNETSHFSTWSSKSCLNLCIWHVSIHADL